MTGWTAVGRRVAAALPLRAGDLVIIRDRCGRPEVVDAVVIAFERRGVTVVVEPASDAVLEAVLEGTEPALLGSWGRHRSRLLELADGVVSLGATPPDLGNVPAEAVSAFRAGRQAMEAVEARRGLPYLTVAVPTARLAHRVGTSLVDLDRLVAEAVTVDVDEIAGAVHAAVERRAADPLVLDTPGCSLVMRRGDRPWMRDSAHPPTSVVRSGPFVGTLPSGSIFTTVEEDSATGSVRVARLAGARDVVLEFRDGRVTAAHGDGASSVLPWLDQFGPDARRIAHVGFGLNPACPADLGWAILDEHHAGQVFLALGENRHLGGTNVSFLNHDVLVPHGSLVAGAVPLVRDGRVVAADDGPADRSPSGPVNRRST